MPLETTSFNSETTRGLTSAEARARLIKFGPNAIIGPSATPW